jgi:hypothetical protein
MSGGRRLNKRRRRREQKVLSLIFLKTAGKTSKTESSNFLLISEAMEKYHFRETILIT